MKVVMERVFLKTILIEKSAPQEPSVKRFSVYPLISDLLFFTALFLFIWLRVRPELIYYFPYSCLYTTPFSIAGLPDPAHTWNRTLSFFFPGSLCDSIGASLTRYYAVPWLGALILTGGAWLLSLACGSFHKVLTGNRGGVLRMLPAIAVLGYCAGYAIHPGAILSALVALGCALLYARAGGSTALLRLGAFVLLSGIVIFLSKAMPVFVLLCMFYEVIVQRSKLPALCMFLVSVMVPIFLMVTRGVVPADWNYWSLWATGDCPLLYAAAAGAAAAGGLAAWYRSDNRPVRGRVGAAAAKVLTVILPFALAILVIAASGIGAGRIDRLLNYDLYTGRWEALLAEARVMPASSWDEFHSHIVDRALFHEGWLLDSLFTFPQEVHGLLLNNVPDMDNAAQFRREVWGAPTFLEIGFVNNAENVSYEALARTSYFPEGLKLLALVHLAKGMPAAAKTFLYALRRDGAYRSFADSALLKLEADSTSGSDGEVAAIRSVMPDSDGITGSSIQSLLEKNPANRMAFEYLAASCLLSRDLAGLSAALRFLPALHYEKLPRLVEEALLIHERVLRAGDNLYGYAISKESTDRFDAFFQVFARYQGQKDAAQHDLAAYFGDSYLFYYLYGCTGKERPQGRV